MDGFQADPRFRATNPEQAQTSSRANRRKHLGVEAGRRPKLAFYIASHTRPEAAQAAARAEQQDQKTPTNDRANTKEAHRRTSKGGNTRSEVLPWPTTGQPLSKEKKQESDRV